MNISRLRKLNKLLSSALDIVDAPQDGDSEIFGSIVSQMEKALETPEVVEIRIESGKILELDAQKYYACLVEENKIATIKKIRETFGFGLKEAKEISEAEWFPYKPYIPDEDDDIPF